MHIANQPKSRLIALLVFVLLLSGAWWYFTSTLTNRVRSIIDDQFNSNVNQPYLIQFEVIDVELLDQEVNLHQVSFIPKPFVKAAIQKNDTAFKGFWLEGTTQNIKLYGWTLIDLITNTIHLDSLVIDQPQINIQENYKLIRDDEQSTSFRELSNQLVYDLKLEGFCISNGKIEYSSNANNHLHLILNNLNLQVQNILVDSVKVANKTFFDADEIDLNFKNLALNTDQIQIGVDEFDYYDFSRLKLKGIQIGDHDSAAVNLSKRQYRNPAVFVAQIDSVVLTAFNIKQIIALDRIQIDSLQIFKPQLTVYQDLGKSHDQSLDKKLPHTLLDDIQVPHKINAIEILNGYLSFKPIGKKTRRTGEIELKNINLTTAQFNNIDSLDKIPLDIKAICQVVGANTNIHIYAEDNQTTIPLHIDVDMASFALKDVNSIIEPVVTAKFNSGKVSRLNLRTQLNQYEVFTSLDMPYNNMQLQIEDANGHEKKWLVSLFANALIYKDANYEKPITTHITRPKYIGFLGAWWRGFQSCLVDEIVIASPRQRQKMRDFLKKHNH